MYNDGRSVLKKDERESDLTADQYKMKADFFDAQVESPWAADEYGPDELARLERMKAELGPLSGKAILEPGCGTGRLTSILSDWVGPSGHVTALDISRGMTDRARQRLAGRSNVRLVNGSLEELEPNPASFDTVLHHQVFPHYNDKALALEITARAVKPGGRVIVFHFINMAQINDTHRKAGTAVEHDMMPHEDEMRRMFEAAGLEVRFVVDDDEGFFLSALYPRTGAS